MDNKRFGEAFALTITTMAMRTNGPSIADVGLGPEQGASSEADGGANYAKLAGLACAWSISKRRNFDHTAPPSELNLPEIWHQSFGMAVGCIVHQFTHDTQ